MGAEQFVTYAKGSNMQDAFHSAHEEAAWEHGHGGYTGTIAEKPGAYRTPREVPRFEATREGLNAANTWAWDDLNEYDNDKWGECLALPVYKVGSDEVEGWYFYGWASS